MIDIHSHILPNCDHGSDSLEVSLKQVKYAVKHRVNTIIATPHFDPREESVTSFLERRQKAWELLVMHPDFPKGLDIVLGAEVSIEHGIERCADLERLAIGNTNYMLLEFSKFEHGRWAFEALDEIEVKGIKPIIAHVHRYDSDTREQVFSLNYYCQINASVIASRDEWAKVKPWILQRQVHFVGSDIHGANESFYKNLEKLYKKLPKQEAERFQNNALHLLK